jgi:uroporphyrinogen decarboxylase
MAAVTNGDRDFTRAPFEPDWEGLRRNLTRQGTPDRVYFLELLIDEEVKAELCRRFRLAPGLDPTAPIPSLQRDIELARFLGYDIVRLRTGCFVSFPRRQLTAPDAGGIAGALRRSERQWTNERRGPIATWEEVESYPWPEPEKADLAVLDWADAHLPPGMTLAGSCHQIFEQTSWLMGLETLCLTLHDDPALVDEVFRRVGDVFVRLARVLVRSDSVGLLFGGDDMGFRGGTILPPEILRQKCLPHHREITRIAHEAGKLNLLHSCGNIDAIMPDLVEIVGIDGKHSFEDVASPVVEAKRAWGDRIAVLGGIDVDFLCRADRRAIEQRVRETLDVCLPGGGYCLGSGNSIANYVPLENYLAMLEAGRRYG